MPVVLLLVYMVVVLCFVLRAFRLSSYRSFNFRALFISEQTAATRRQWRLAIYGIFGGTRSSNICTTVSFNRLTTYTTTVLLYIILPHSNSLLLPFNHPINKSNNNNIYTVYRILARQS